MTELRIPDPGYMQLQDWADNVVLNLASTVYVGRLDGNDWREWGANLILQARPLWSSSPPDPYSFADWRDWGIALIKAVAE